MLFGAASLLAVCACMYKSRQDRWWKHWAALSGLFCLLSMDESASFHEILMIPMDALVNAKGMLYFSWVIPGFAFVAIVGFAFLAGGSTASHPIRHQSSATAPSPDVYG